MSNKCGCVQGTTVQQTSSSLAEEEEDDDDDIDLFGSDDDEEAEKLKEQRLKAYAEKKAKKPVLIAKSSILLDVKPVSLLLKHRHHTFTSSHFITSLPRLSVG